MRNAKINTLYKKYGGMRCPGKLMGIKVNLNQNIITKNFNCAIFDHELRFDDS